MMGEAEPPAQAFPGRAWERETSRGRPVCLPWADTRVCPYQVHVISLAAKWYKIMLDQVTPQ